MGNVGTPISNELAEQSPLDGKVYMVQYFERAEFEYHPENSAPYAGLLVQLGRFAYAANHGPKPTPASPRQSYILAQGDCYVKYTYIQSWRCAICT